MLAAAASRLVFVAPAFQVSCEGRHLAVCCDCGISSVYVRVGMQPLTDTHGWLHMLLLLLLLLLLL